MNSLQRGSFVVYVVEVERRVGYSNDTFPICTGYFPDRLGSPGGSSDGLYDLLTIREREGRAGEEKPCGTESW